MMMKRSPQQKANRSWEDNSKAVEKSELEHNQIKKPSHRFRAETELLR